MDADLMQQQAAVAEWLVVEEDDWSGVNDCGAIFVPNREMRFEIDDEEWSRSQRC
jgi:hypothetical protein